MGWQGERGATYFLQSELPYGVDENWANKGYVAYRVADGVTSHQAWGIGVYHYMRDHQITWNTGIACPAQLESSFKSPFAVYLNGKGKMNHVINDKGPATFGDGNGADAQWYCANGAPAAQNASLIAGSSIVFV